MDAKCTRRAYRDSEVPRFSSGSEPDTAVNAKLGTVGDIWPHASWFVCHRTDLNRRFAQDLHCSMHRMSVQPVSSCTRLECNDARGE
jgi:hypothetical protein